LKTKKSATSMLAKLMLIFVLVAAFSVPGLSLGKAGENNALAATNSFSICPSNTRVAVNGVNANCAAYNINGNNYVKLRDVACLVNGTDASFNVGWNANKNCINLITNCNYNKIGGELSGTPSKTATAKCTTSKINVNGRTVDLKAYNVNCCNYFKLRDLAKALGFNVACTNTGKVVITCNGSGSNQNTTGSNTSTGTNTNTNTGNTNSTGSTINEQNASQAELVLYYTNQERAKAGLSKLGTMTALDAAAQVRAKEIVSQFAHTRPNGSSCFTVLSGISYSSAGENIAMGQPDAKSVVTAWMNSPGHRANILNAKFTKLGVGVYKVNGTMYWSQEFIGN